MREAFVEAGRAAWPHILGEAVVRLEAPERWREAIVSQDDAVFVAELDGEIVGFGVALAETGELDSLYTQPAVWGRGAGRALMDEALAFLAARGLDAAVLWTEERNERPRRVYEAYGWRLDGTERRRTHLGGKLVELRYGIALPPSHVAAREG